MVSEPKETAKGKAKGTKDGSFSSSDRMRDGPNGDDNQSFDEGRNSQDRL